MTTEYDVTQRTILGIIFFNIILNGLFDVCLCGDIISFIDDIVLIYSDSNRKTLEEKAELEFKQINFSDNKLLSVNCIKT